MSGGRKSKIVRRPKKAFIPRELSFTRRTPGFPREQIVKLRYVENYTLTPVSIGTVVKQVFRANSVFDPNQGIGGHQPMLFDMWAGLYNHYQVLYSTITTDLTPSGSLNYPVYAGAYLSDDTVTPTDAYLIKENGKGTQRLLSTQPDTVTRFTNRFNMKSFFTESVDNGNTSSTVSSTPSEEAFYTIYAQQTGGTGDSLLVLTSEITYTVRFFEPKDQVAS